MGKLITLLEEIATETWHLYVEVAIYLLFGFLVAGVLYLLFPRNFVARHLGRGNTAAVLKASLFGIPLPLCSCGVIPTALSLRKRGASRGATLSFMISTPQTGVDSILITGGLFGPLFALLRPVFSMITATATGLVSNFAARNGAPDVYSDPDGEEEPHPPATWRARIYDMLHYAFEELFGSIYKWLVVGLILAGIIAAALPEDALTGELGQGLTGKLVMLVLGIPMYICATASTPIAYGLVAKGMSVGGAFVFLLAGPATNVATVTMVARYLGRTSVIIYLTTIAIVAVASGLIIDALVPADYVLPYGGPAHAHRGPSVLQWIGVVVITLLICRLVIREFAGRMRRGEPAAVSNTMALQVEGMTCMHCKGTVERVVAALPGVESVQVDLATKGVRIHARQAMPPLEQIKKTIEDEGYEVVD